MWIRLWSVVSLSVFLQPSVAHACTSDGPGSWLAAERMAAEGPVVVVRYDDDSPLTLVQGGQPVPFTQTVHTDGIARDFDLAVLQPDQPVAAGVPVELTDDAEQLVGTLTVVDTVIPALVSNPVSRHLEAEIIGDIPCESYEIEITRAVYRLCADGVVFVGVVGDDTPPEVSLTDIPRDWALSDGLQMDLARRYDLEPGGSYTAWFGAWNEAGTFSGWSAPERFTMPASRHRSESQRELNEDPGTTIATNEPPPSCAADGPWEELAHEICDQQGCRDVTDPTGGGCTHGSPEMPLLWWTLIGLWGARRRRESGDASSP